MWGKDREEKKRSAWKDTRNVVVLVVWMEHSDVYVKPNEAKV